MTKFLALISVFCMAVGLQIVVMIYGWGLSPKNWWVIIGLGVIGSVFAHSIARKVIDEFNKKGEK